MKKTLALLLTLTLLVTLAMPILAAETRTARICPACGGTGYEHTVSETWREAETCNNYPNVSHFHDNVYRVTYSICEDCGTQVYITRKLYSTTCKR